MDRIWGQCPKVHSPRLQFSPSAAYGLNTECVADRPFDQGCRDTEKQANDTRSWGEFFRPGSRDHEQARRRSQLRSSLSHLKKNSLVDSIIGYGGKYKSKAQ